MMYNKNEISKLATETGFIRDNIEKVLRLIDVLSFISNNNFLSERLVLKGGTAINLTVFEMPRLSVDIDLDFSQNVSFLIVKNNLLINSTMESSIQICCLRKI